MKTYFDAQKAVEMLLYVVKKVPDMYNALKIVYFADRKHLNEYGRQICDDTYIAMKHGPVPSGCYDIIKYARGDGYCDFGLPIRDILSVNDNALIPQRESNLDYLSESDIECIDDAIEQYGNLPFWKIEKASHDPAYKSVDQNDSITFEALVSSLPNGKQLLEHLNDG